MAAILFGNGFNRLTLGNLSWEDLLKKISKGTDLLNRIPNTFIYESIILQKLKVSSILEEQTPEAHLNAMEKAEKSSIANLMNNYKSNPCYKRLAS